METKKSTKVREWYKMKFPVDYCIWNGINPDVTFRDIFNGIDQKKDIYKMLGIHDSFLREQVFSQVASLYDCSYRSLYEKWIGSPVTWDIPIQIIKDQEGPKE